MEENKILELLLDGINAGKNLPDILDFHTISRLPFCESSEIRCLTAEFLADDCESFDGESILLLLAQDSDALVRCYAVDSLSNYITERSFSACANALGDTESLVRGYAAFGVAVIGNVLHHDETVLLLQQAKNQETDAHTLAELGEARYIVGVESGLQEMMEQYFADDYRLQIAILHHFQEILCEENFSKIEAFVKSVKNKSTSRAVKENIEEVLASCRRIAYKRTHY